MLELNWYLFEAMIDGSSSVQDLKTQVVVTIRGEEVQNLVCRIISLSHLIFDQKI